MHCDLCEMDSKPENLYEREINGVKLHICNATRICLMRTIMNTPLKDLHTIYDPLLQEVVTRRV